MRHRAAHEQLPRRLVALLGDAPFCGSLSPDRSVAGTEAQVGSHRAALLEAVGVFQSEHEGKRRERPYPLDLPQEMRFRVAL